MAIQYSNLDVANTLIDRGADIKKMSPSAQTPLHVAAKVGCIEIVNTLIEHGATIDQLDIDFYTPLAVAIDNRYVEVAKVLIKKGAGINAPYSRSSRYTVLEEIVRIHKNIYEFVISHIENLEANGLYVNEKNLRLKDRLKSEIFLHNHKPLIDALSTHYERDFQMMKFADIKTFFQEHKDDIVLELGGIEKHLIEFVDFEDIRERHVPRLELQAFAERVKNNAPRENLDSLSARQVSVQQSSRVG